MGKDRTAHDEGFEQGVLWAVARIIELHDEPTVAASVLHESGFGLDLRRADAADRKYLKVLKNERQFNSRAA